MNRNGESFIIVIVVMMVAISATTSLADHPAVVQDRARICTKSQSSLAQLSEKISHYKSTANGPSYSELLAQYNKELARYTLFDGINQIIKNYKELVSDIRYATTLDRTINMGTFIVYDPRVGKIPLGSITNVIMIEQTISSILGSEINLSTLSQFSSPVCPDQDLQSPILSQCPTNNKLSPLYLALKKRCSDAANSSQQLCLTLSLLEKPRNVVTLNKTQELLENFRKAYRNAYLVQSGHGNELNDPVHDLELLRESLFTLEGMTIYENEDVDVNDLFLSTQEQKKQASKRAGSNLDERVESAIGMGLVSQAQKLDQWISMASDLAQEYSQCLANINARSAARALCPGIDQSLCHHSKEFTPQRIQWQEERLLSCQRCLKEDVNACLTSGEITELFPEGNIPSGGIEGAINYFFTRFVSNIEGPLNDTLLARSLMGSNLVRGAGIQSAEQATQLSISAIQNVLMNPNNKESLKAIIKDVSINDYESRKSFLEFIKRNQGSTEIKASELTQFFYTGQDSLAKQFQKVLLKNYNASRNEEMLLQSLGQGHSKDHAEGLIESEIKDTPSMYHHMLTAMLDAAKSPAASFHLNCLKQNNNYINRDYLDQNKSDLTLLGSLMHQCMQELGNQSEKSCEELPQGPKRQACLAALANSEQFMKQKDSISTRLSQLAAELRSIEANSELASLFRTQQLLISIASKTCQGDQEVLLVGCHNNTSLPLDATRGKLSFLVNNTNKVLGYVPSFEIDTRDTAQLISTLKRNHCPKGDRAAANATFDLCQYEFPTVTQSALAQSSPMITAVSEPIPDAAPATERTSKSTGDEQVDDVGRSRRAKSPSRAPASYQNSSSNSALATEISKFSYTFGSMFGSSYGNNYGYNSNFGMNPNQGFQFGTFPNTGFNSFYGGQYAFPNYPQGFYPYSGNPFQPQLVNPLFQSANFRGQ